MIPKQLNDNFVNVKIDNKKNEEKLPPGKYQVRIQSAKIIEKIDSVVINFVVENHDKYEGRSGSNWYRLSDDPHSKRKSQAGFLKMDMSRWGIDQELLHSKEDDALYRCLEACYGRLVNLQVIQAGQYINYRLTDLIGDGVEQLEEIGGRF